jgi:hypothetical protein
MLLLWPNISPSFDIKRILAFPKKVFMRESPLSFQEDFYIPTKERCQFGNTNIFLKTHKLKIVVVWSFFFG